MRFCDDRGVSADREDGDDWRVKRWNGTDCKVCVLNHSRFCGVYHFIFFKCCFTSTETIRLTWYGYCFKVAFPFCLTR